MIEIEVTTKVEALPCPFCGSEDVRLSAMEAYVLCNACKTEGPLFISGSKKSATVTRWNDRTPQPTPAPDATATADRLAVAEVLLQRTVALTGDLSQPHFTYNNWEDIKNFLATTDQSTLPADDPPSDIRDVEVKCRAWNSVQGDWRGHKRKNEIGYWKWRKWKKLNAHVIRWRELTEDETN